MQMNKGGLKDLFTETAVILNAILSDNYYGMLRGLLRRLTAIHMHKKCSTLCEVLLRHCVYFDSTLVLVLQ